MDCLRRTDDVLVAISEQANKGGKGFGIKPVICIELAEILSCSYSECGINARATVAVRLVDNAEYAGIARFVITRYPQRTVRATIIYHDDLQCLEKLLIAYQKRV